MLKGELPSCRSWYESYEVDQSKRWISTGQPSQPSQASNLFRCVVGSCWLLFFGRLGNDATMVGSIMVFHGSSIGLPLSSMTVQCTAFASRRERSAANLALSRLGGRVRSIAMIFHDLISAVWNTLSCRQPRHLRKLAPDEDPNDLNGCLFPEPCPSMYVYYVCSIYIYLSIYKDI